MNTIRKTLKDLSQYPTAIAGLIILLIFVIISITTIITFPYSKAIRLWRGSEEDWYKTPKLVPPSWTNLFRSQKLPDTVDLTTKDGSIKKTVTQNPSGTSTITMDFPLNFSYDQFPQELNLYLTSTFNQKAPFVSITWKTPDGREIRVGDFGTSEEQTFIFSQDTKLTRRLNGVPARQGLFADPANPNVPLKGTYNLHISTIAFEPDSKFDAEFIMYGRVYGLAGTDYLRRDLMVALLWGMPVALAFGLLAALGTTLTTMIIAAVGTWYGGWVDDLIQRITEVNLVLPFLPILIMIGYLYSRSIFVILGATILLSIFGGGIKTYRAIFMQVRESPFIEAARAYGTGSARIIFNYLVPRIIPLLIPQLVVLVPSYVFLEASLAVLGLGDPVMPTWGKIIQDAQSNSALYQGYYYWVLEPAALLMVTGLAFALLGFALDRIFNPRLRGM